MQADAIFSGGGVKALAILGALEEAENRGIRFSRAAGTSAGAIIAALLMAGYTSRDMLNIIKDVDLKQFADPRRPLVPGAGFFHKWITLYWKMGLYKGDAFEKWLRDLLKQRGVETFSDLPSGTLKVVASDLTRGRLVVLPNDLPEYGINPEAFSIARAVRMSSSLPYFFEPIKLYNGRGQKHFIVDGGVLSNFPIWLFQNGNGKDTRPLLGFRLSATLEETRPNKIDNAFELYQALFGTMKEAHDARYISSKYRGKIIFLPVDQVQAGDFTLTDEKKQALIELGKKEATAFLKKRWSY